MLSNSNSSILVVVVVAVERQITELREEGDLTFTLGMEMGDISLLLLVDVNCDWLMLLGSCRLVFRVKYEVEEGNGDSF